MKIVTGKSKKFGTVIARSGAGKTLLCHLLIKAQNKACIVVDTFEQFESEYTMSFEELVEAFNNNDFKESFYKYKKTIVLRMGNGSLDSFFKLLMNSTRFNELLVFVDEIDLNLQSARVNNDDGFYEFLNRGRHKNFDLLTTCRNTANIPKPLIAQTDYFYFSDLIEKGALDFVENTLKGMNVTEELQKLETYEFLIVDVNNKGLTKLKPKLEWLDLF
ncbi:MAG: hypothetical protein GQ570_12145 [Helicobacteraceae bacterium]|nr:hypothetical protein [Helicobacteraceae bacterium]